MAGSIGVNIVNSQKVNVRDCEITLSGNEGVYIEASSAQIENNNS